MADVIEKAPSVELADALHAGFHAAMERVEALNLDPCSTLVDAISQDAWASWDASSECALVLDSDGLNGDDGELDGELDLAA